MTNHLDLPREEADALLATDKTAPSTEWVLQQGGRIEIYVYATGVVTEAGLYQKALTVELICKRTAKPLRETYKMSLFRSEYGASRRAYQLDTSNLPLCDPGDHDWPHEHIGTDRLVFPSHGFPMTFEDSIEHFCGKVNIEFEDPIESPFDFKLRPLR